VRKDFRKQHNSAVIIQRFYRDYVQKRRKSNLVENMILHESVTEYLSSQLDCGSPELRAIQSVKTDIDSSKTADTDFLASTCMSYASRKQIHLSNLDENLELIQGDLGLISTLISTGKHALLPRKAPLSQVLDEVRVGGGGLTYPKIPYLEGMAGLISRRRMPRVSEVFISDQSKWISAHESSSTC
jgi:hypothetical protein